MSRTPGSDVHEDAVHEFRVLLKGGVYQSVLSLSQGNHIGVVSLELLAVLRKILGQLVHLNLVAQQVVEEEVGSTFVLFVAKHDEALSAFLHGALKELLLMAQEHLFLVGSSLQGSDAGSYVVADVLGKAVQAQ